MKKVIQEVHTRYPNQNLNDKIAFIKTSVKEVRLVFENDNSFNCFFIIELNFKHLKAYRSNDGVEQVTTNVCYLILENFKLPSKIAKKFEIQSLDNT
jgi:hypothetical protein